MGLVTGRGRAVRIVLIVLGCYLSGGVWPLWLGWRWLGQHRPDLRRFLVLSLLAVCTLGVSLLLAARCRSTGRTVYVRAHYRRRPRRRRW